MNAIDPATRPAQLGATVLAGLALVLALINAQELGGWAALAQAWRQPLTAPVEAVQLLHAWLPRLTVAALAGAGLAGAGTVMQQVLRNPIASPMTLGVAAGAQLTLSILTLTAPALLTAWGDTAAVLGGAATLGLVVGLASRRGLEPVTLVLAGLVVSLYLGAVNAGLLLFFERDLTALLIWGGGSLAQHGWMEVTALAPRLAGAAILLALLLRPLGLLTLDDANAQSLGLRLQRTRLIALAAAVYLTGVIVTAVGIVGFIGLAAPALARLGGARTVRQRLVWAPLLGAGLLMAADQAVQLLNQHTAALVPTGAVTALLGAPLVLWLLQQLRPAAPTASVSPTLAQLPRAGPLRAAAVSTAAVIALLIAIVVSRDAGGWQLEGIATVLGEAPWRLPRIAAAACAGVLLAVAGTLLQRVLGNPMASPEVLGISGGALIGVVAAVLLLPSASQPALIAAGSAGGLCTVAGLLLFARRFNFAPQQVLLAGVALKALFDGLVALVGASGSQHWPRLLAWMSGSTYGTSWSAVAGALVVMALALPAALALHRWLELLGLGSEQADARGLRVRRARMVLLVIAAMATAVATLLVGPLSFVGLMAPHLATLLGFRRARSQLLAAGAIGLALMVIADWAGRWVFAPYEWPAGIAASMLGGLYFMWLLRRL